jgi:glucose-6-phosphate dehydrogenase assembly protein OpcA
MNELDGRFGTDLTSQPVVNLRALEQELARMWRPDTAADPVSGTLPTRTSVLNLVIYASDEQQHEQAIRAAQQLAAVHSSRIILFSGAQQVLSRGASAEIITPAGYEIDSPHTPCIEHICIPAVPSTLSQLPSLIAPLVIPELPTFMWWPGSPPLAEPAAREITRNADRLIVDSLAFGRTRELVDLHDFVQIARERTSVADLNWIRLQPWRELTAQFFDIPAIRWSLHAVREVEIEIGELASRELPAQAQMFACWLTNRLGWTLFESRRTRADRWHHGLTDGHGDPIRVMVRSRPSGREFQGHMISIGIIARDKNGQSSSLSLSRARGSSLIRMHAKSGLITQLHHAVHQPLLREEALIAHALESTHRDHVFESTLEHTAHAITRLEGT